MANLRETLKQHGACAEAIEWAKPYKSLKVAWAKCERGDWMLWFAARAELCTRQQLVLAACACARLALPHVPKGEKRPLAAIETAERWAHGEDGVSLEMVRFAAASADAAAAAADDADDHAAAADDAAAAAAAAAAADHAAAYAAYAAYAAADAARQTTVLKRCADIVREHSKSWTPGVK